MVQKIIRVEEVPVPKPGPGEVIIKVRACGICGSDLKAYHGLHNIGQEKILG